jgi:hypothetical protein
MHRTRAVGRSFVALAWLVACNGDKVAAPSPDPWGGEPSPTKPAAPADPWGAQPSPSAPSAPAAPRAPSDPSSPVGLWYGAAFDTGMHYEMSSANYQYNTKLKIAFALVRPDGTMIHGAPWAGLADFDYAAWARDVQRDASLGGVAGTYTWSGASGEVTLSTGYKEPIALADGKLTLGNTKLQRPTSVDGVTLDGTYTYFTNTADPYLDGPGCKQMITFRPDGTFDDRGAFVLACPPADSEANPPGAGTYALRDFTLILSYGDGHQRTFLITPPLNGDLRKDAAHFLLRGGVWNRR